MIIKEDKFNVLLIATFENISFLKNYSAECKQAEVHLVVMEINISLVANFVV